MQTFLPYADYDISASVLDMKRLGKQRVEVLQILNTLKNGSRWRNHPAVLMWKGHEQDLIKYGCAICLEWKRRGYKDTCYEKINNMRSEFPQDTTRPEWLGDENFHQSHRSNLLRKNSTHYEKYWKGRDDLPYVWPVVKLKT